MDPDDNKTHQPCLYNHIYMYAYMNMNTYEKTVYIYKYLYRYVDSYTYICIYK